jgi:hypothetical protein
MIQRQADVTYFISDTDTAVMLHRPRIVGIALRVRSGCLARIDQHTRNISPGEVEGQIHADGASADN